MESFRKLGIQEPILKVIREKRFEIPTEIQEKTIPLILEGKDVIAGSATGSGKTLAFGSGIIENVESGKGVQALVLTPTRELCEQVSHALEEFSKHKDLEVVPIYGGVSITNQIKKLSRADIVVATPGRLLDHMQRNSVDLSNVKFLVLDEADRMWDMGFKDDVGKIVKKCPEKRQTMLFSATIGPELADFSEKYMKNPAEVSVEAYVDASKLKQVYYDVRDNEKFSLLVHLIKNEKAHLIMIFCNTRRNADLVAKNLKLKNINVQVIHGGMEQSKRNRVIKNFDKNINVLVCTDVAARGLHIEGVSHIYNYDMPSDPKDYVHRIGRTARAGKEGIAINLIASRDYDNFAYVQKHHSEIFIKRENTPIFERIFADWGSPRDRRPRSGGSNFRGSSGGKRFGKSNYPKRSSGGSFNFRGRDNQGGSRNTGRRDSGGDRSFSKNRDGWRRDPKSSRRFGGNRDGQRRDSGSSGNFRKKSGFRRNSDSRKKSGSRDGFRGRKRR